MASRTPTLNAKGHDQNRKEHGDASQLYRAKRTFRFFVLRSLDVSIIQTEPMPALPAKVRLIPASGAAAGTEQHKALPSKKRCS
jgi:hypothetical protein